MAVEISAGDGGTSTPHYTAPLSSEAGSVSTFINYETMTEEHRYVLQVKVSDSGSPVPDTVSITVEPTRTTNLSSTTPFARRKIARAHALRRADVQRRRSPAYGIAEHRTKQRRLPPLAERKRADPDASAGGFNFEEQDSLDHGQGHGQWYPNYPEVPGHHRGDRRERPPVYLPPVAASEATATGSVIGTLPRASDPRVFSGTRLRTRRRPSVDMTMAVSHLPKGRTSNPPSPLT